jgi:hypothetical protein
MEAGGRFARRLVDGVFLLLVFFVRQNCYSFVLLMVCSSVAEGGQESLPPCCACEDDGGTPVPGIVGGCYAVLGGEKNE